jgi:hypothetical protein
MIGELVVLAGHDGRTPLHFRTHWKASAGVAMATRRGCAD